jgi:putative transposase
VIWSYFKPTRRVAITAENYGIAVYAVSEDKTSRLCAYHGCEVARNLRGLIHCPPWARHALRYQRRPERIEKGGEEPPASFRTKSYIVTPGGVKPIKGE